MGFIAELRRRNVSRVAGLYVVGAWLAASITISHGLLLGSCVTS